MSTPVLQRRVGGKLLNLEEHYAIPLKMAAYPEVQQRHQSRRKCNNQRVLIAREHLLPNESNAIAKMAT